MFGAISLDHANERRRDAGPFCESESTMAKVVDEVSTQHPSYRDMAVDWELIDALMGGTKAMQDDTVKWLPREEKEPIKTYTNRLERSVLFNGYAKAVRELSNKPFSKPLSLKGKALPEPLNLIETSADDERRKLQDFARFCLDIALRRGLVHILVDYPQEGSATLGEQRRAGIKPTFVAVDPKSLIGWNDHVAANGERVLDQIRIKDSYLKNTGRFTLENQDRIRVIEPDHWEVYERMGDAWVSTGEGDWTVGKITLTTVYLDRKDFMVARPTLQHLAELNLSHYRQMSDYLNTLRFAGTGMIFAKGLDKADIDKPIIMGVNYAFKTTSTEADVSIVEHSGAALNACREALLDTETRMSRCANEPMTLHSWGNETAIGRAIDEGQGSCDLQSWVRQLEQGLDNSYEFAAEWERTTLPDDFGVDIFDDFGVSGRSDSDLSNLLQARMAGQISHLTYLREVKARAMLSDSLDPEQEIERIRQEGPSLGAFGRTMENEHENE